MADLQVGGRVFLAGTDINGRFALRSCALHYALDEGHMQRSSTPSARPGAAVPGSRPAAGRGAES